MLVRFRTSSRVRASARTWPYPRMSWPVTAAQPPSRHAKSAVQAGKDGVLSDAATLKPGLPDAPDHETRTARLMQ